LRPKSPQPPSLPRFALDQNFPRPILDSVLARWIPELTIVALSDVDPRLTKDHDDWEVILALHQLGYEGFISLDKDMIHLPDVVAMVAAGPRITAAVAAIALAADQADEDDRRARRRG
jgi:hypothetical protein